jgi:hypothetical protein
MMIVNDRLGRMAVKLVTACFKVVCSRTSENSENPEEVCLLEYNAMQSVDSQHGIIYQKIELFITTVLRTLNPAQSKPC